MKYKVNGTLILKTNVTDSEHIEFCCDQEFICKPTQGECIEVYGYYFKVSQIIICKDHVTCYLEDKTIFDINDYNYFKQWEICCEM